MLTPEGAKAFRLGNHLLASLRYDVYECHRAGCSCHNLGPRGGWSIRKVTTEEEAAIEVAAFAVFSQRSIGFRQHFSTWAVSDFGHTSPRDLAIADTRVQAWNLFVTYKSQDASYGNRHV